MKGRTHPGSHVVHGSRCACPQCDPLQTKVKAARAAALAAKKGSEVPTAGSSSTPQREVNFRSAGAAPARPAVTFREPRADSTRRLMQLFREGKTFAQAAEIIEAERQQPKPPEEP